MRVFSLLCVCGISVMLAGCLPPPPPAGSTVERPVHYASSPKSNRPTHAVAPAPHFQKENGRPASRPSVQKAPKPADPQVQMHRSGQEGKQPHMSSSRQPQRLPSSDVSQRHEGSRREVQKSQRSQPQKQGNRFDGNIRDER